jgi:PAS domain S-box-containing protein
MRLKWLLTIMCLAISLIPIAMISGLQGLQIASMFLGLILLVTLTVAFVVSYFISIPLVKLTKNIDEISKGNLDVELEKSEIYEINNLTDSLDRVMASLKLAIHKVGLKKEEIFEEALKAKEEAEERLEILLKKIDGWIWEIDEKGICTKCSAKVAETLGCAPKQIIGKEIFDFLPPDDAKKLKEIIHSISKQKSESLNKYDLFWMNKEKNEPIWVRSFFLPVFDRMGSFHGLRCFSRNATEYHVAEEKIGLLEKKIDELQKQLRPVFQQHAKERSTAGYMLDPTTEEFDYMIMFDENAKIIDCTNDIQKKLGYTKQELLSHNFADLVYLESYDDIKANLTEIKKQGTMEVKNIHRKKDGASIFVSEHIIYVKDRNMFICKVKQDIM